jgi:hypothetical protein
MNYEQPFDIMALDSSYNLVAIIAYNKIQWNRKCLEPGIFSIELTTEQYSNNWCYIYSPQRRELGRISQINMTIKNELLTVTISGKFIEADVDRMIVYPKPTYEYSASQPHTSIVNGPSWLGQSGDADDVAMAFFDAFKTITYRGYDVGDYTGEDLKERTYTLDIIHGIIDLDNGSYVRAEHNRNGEYLGHKLSLILKASKAFFTVDYDRSTNVKTLNIRHGRDLTSDNAQGNNPIVFGTLNGTIASAGIVRSTTDTKDIGIAIQSNENETVILVDGYDEAIGRFHKVDNLPSVSDYADDHDYRIAALQNITNVLSDNVDKLNLSFNVFDGSYEYITDFDLGDIVTVTIPEIDLDVDVQIIGCYESIQNGVWSLNIEFGTPLKRR